jgi:hypothetical protein
MLIRRVVAAGSALQQPSGFLDLPEDRIKEQRHRGRCQHLTLACEELRGLGLVSKSRVKLFVDFIPVDAPGLVVDGRDKVHYFAEAVPAVEAAGVVLVRREEPLVPFAR